MKVEGVTYMLMAQDMDRAVAFYRDVVGLKPRFSSPMWSELTFGDAIVALHGGGIVALHGGGSAELRSTGLSFQVEDLKSAVREIERGGGRVTREPEDRPGEPIRLAEAVDTEGNSFALTEMVA